MSYSKRNPGGGNKAALNETPNLIEAIIMAAEQVGSNGRGKDGLVGYLQTVARR